VPVERHRRHAEEVGDVPQTHRLETDVVRELESGVDDPGLAALLEHKYGWQKRLVDRLNRKSRGTAAFAAIEIVDA
jgi:hypothetical protein